STPRSGVLSGKANMPPGTYNVDVRISDQDGGIADALIPIVVGPQDAAATYNGTAYVSTASATSSTAQVTLHANIVVAGAATDGDVRKATVTFINRDTGAIIAANVPVTLPTASDHRRGVANYNWKVDIGSANARTFTIGIIVNGYYTRDSSFDNALITVAKPLTYSIAGGGYLVNKKSAGFLAGEIGLRTHFGFNVKFNKGGGSPQGQVNFLVRSYQLPNGTRDNKPHLYQVRSTAISSLSSSTDASGRRHATFTALDDVMDVSDPLASFSVATGLRLDLSVTDASAGDSISVKLSSGSSL